MKIFFLFAAAAIAMAVTFTGCNPENKVKEIKVTGVELDRETLSFTMGDPDVTLIATITPTEATNQDVTWNSSDPLVATVVDGLVHPLKPGDTRITVKTVEGEFEDYCDVTVNAAPVPVTSITLSAETLSLARGESATLVATVLPEGADNPAFTWDLSSEDVIDIDENGVITPKAAGIVTVTVKTTEGDFTDECVVTVEGVLLAGVVWAEYNVNTPGTFTDSQEKVGMFYKWGSKIGWSNTDPVSSSEGASSWDNTILNSSDANWAAADSPCPTGWRLPTIEEFILMSPGRATAVEFGQNDIVKWEVDVVNGVVGTKFSDLAKPELSIFLPADGYRIGGMANGMITGKNNGTTGNSSYWASSVILNSSNVANTSDGQRLSISRTNPTVGPRVALDPYSITTRVSAFPLRCVRAE